MKYIKIIIALLIFSLFVFLPIFAIFSATVWKVIYTVIASIYVLMNFRTLKQSFVNIDKYMMITLSLCIYLVSIVWGLCVIIYNNGEFSYFGYWIVGLYGRVVTYVFLAIILMKWFKPNNVMKSFLLFFLVAIFLQTLSTMIFLFDYNIKNMWFSLLEHTSSNVNMMDDMDGAYLTRVSFKGFSVFGDTIRCSLALILYLYLKKRYKVPYKWDFLALFALLGNVFYGRSGLIFSLAFLLIYALLNLSVKNIKNICVYGIVVFSVAAGIINFAESNPVYLNAMKWVMDPFYSVVDSITYGSHVSLGHSSDNMMSMYFLPNENTILIGDGRFQEDDGHYYMRTDVGVMRHMLFYGVVGQSLGYLIYIILCINWLMINKNDATNRWLIAGFIGLLIFGEIKGTPLTELLSMLVAMTLMNGMDICNKKKRWCGDCWQNRWFR